jgi:hypothetical protein
MKTKARDIVEGWPKGRSTVSSFDNAIDYRYNIFKEARMSTCFAISPMHISWDNGFCKYKFEETFETTYHQMQQAMVNEWFARYRSGLLDII